jgi:PAS domain S-box-containing protein
MNPKQLKKRINAETLRERAESQLARISPDQEPGRSASEMLHELQVRQIELEIQNEELRCIHLALEESRDHYADLYEFAPIGYITLSRDGLVTEINLAGAALLGAQRNKILSRRFVRYVMPEQRDDWHRHFMNALKTGRNQPGEFTLVRGDGSSIHVRMDSQCREGVALRIALTDITGQKSAAEALRVSEERMRLFFERQLVGMAITSPEKGWLRVNQKICDMLGYTAEELSKLSWAEVTHPDDLAPDVAWFERMLAGEIDSYTVEKRYIRKDGGIVYAALSIGCVRKAEGKVDYVLALIEDVSLSKHEEMKLEAAQKLLRARNSELQVYRSELEQRIEEQTAELRESNRKLRAEIAERKQAELDLNASRVRLKRAIAQRDATREEERKRIALEVHDELGQVLTGLKLQVSNLARRCSALGGEFSGNVQEIAELSDRAMTVARNITVALRPVEADMGIVAALELQASRFSAVTGIQTVCTFPDDAILLNERCTTALYRIVQEALTNVARHAHAGMVDISLCEERGGYVVKVRDNGTGFDPAARKPDSFGLPGIRERVLTLGGSFNINSGAGAGAEIIVRIPAEICHV